MVVFTIALIIVSFIRNPFDNISISFVFRKYRGDTLVANPQSLGTGHVLRHKEGRNKHQFTGVKHSSHGLEAPLQFLLTSLRELVKKKVKFFFCCCLLVCRCSLKVQVGSCLLKWHI